MCTLTRFVLKHKLLVIAFWLILALAGAMTATSTTKRLTSSFAMPGAAFRAEARIQGLYLHDGAQDPTVPVITLPPGTRIHTPGVDRQLDHAFAAARQIIPTARTPPRTTRPSPPATDAAPTPWSSPPRPTRSRPAISPPASSALSPPLRPPPGR